MKIWAADPLRARSKFWFFMRRIRKIQKTKGQIISCREIFERKPTVSKNFCVWISYASRTGNHNAYKEYRDLSLNGAVKQLYLEMASRHRTRSESIHLIRTAVAATTECKRAATIQYNDKTIHFPVIHKTLRPSRGLYKKILKGNRPPVFCAKRLRLIS